MTTFNPRQWIPVALAGTAILAVYLVYLNPVPDFDLEQQNDPSMYISLAKSLLAGEGYPTKHWMPGFPALLAGWIAAVGLDFVRLKLFMVGVAVVLVVSSFAYYRRLVGPRPAAWLALLVAVVPVVFAYSHKLMGEVPCTALAMLALALAEAERGRGEATTGRRLLSLLALASVAAAAVLVRGNAVGLAPALLAASVRLGPSAEGRRYRVRWPLLVAGLCAGAVFVGWSVRNQSVEYTGINNVTYLEEVRAVDLGALWAAGGLQPSVETVDAPGLVRRVRENLVWYHSYNVADSLLPGAGGLRAVTVPGVGFALAALLCVPAVLGIVPLFRLSPAGGTFLVLSFAVLLVYPTGGAPRMLVPCVPLLVVAGYLGVRSGLGPNAAGGWAAVAVCAGVVHGAVSGHRQSEHPYSFDSFGDFVAVLDRADRGLAGSESVLVSNQPEAVAALTRFRPADLPAAVSDLREGRRPSFLVVEFETFRPVAELPADVSRSLIEEYRGIHLWRVAPGPGKPGDRGT